MNTQGDFDTDAVNRLHALGGDTLVTRIARLFADFAAARVNDAVTACEAGDLLRIADAAHAVRSSAANVGATRLLGIATTLEQDARSGRTESVPALVSDLRSAYDGARAYVLSCIPRGDA